jgi:hypothetical protein
MMGLKHEVLKTLGFDKIVEHVMGPDKDTGARKYSFG